MEQWQIDLAALQSQVETLQAMVPDNSPMEARLGALATKLDVLESQAALLTPEALASLLGSVETGLNRIADLEEKLATGSTPAPVPEAPLPILAPSPSGAGDPPSPAPMEPLPNPGPVRKVNRFL